MTFLQLAEANPVLYVFFIGGVFLLAVLAVLVYTLLTGGYGFEQLGEFVSGIWSANSEVPDYLVNGPTSSDRDKYHVNFERGTVYKYSKGKWKKTKIKPSHLVEIEGRRMTGDEARLYLREIVESKIEEHDFEDYLTLNIKATPLTNTSENTGYSYGATVKVESTSKRAWQTKSKALAPIN